MHVCVRVWCVCICDVYVCSVCVLCGGGGALCDVMYIYVCVCVCDGGTLVTRHVWRSENHWSILSTLLMDPTHIVRLAEMSHLVDHVTFLGGAGETPLMLASNS